MEFPSLTNSQFDIIIERYWKGQFTLLKDLSEETKLLCDGNDLSRSLPSTLEYYTDLRNDCHYLIDNGLLVFD